MSGQRVGNKRQNERQKMNAPTLTKMAPTWRRRNGRYVRIPLTCYSQVSGAWYRGLTAESITKRTHQTFRTLNGPVILGPYLIN